MRNGSRTFPRVVYSAAAPSFCFFRFLIEVGMGLVELSPCGILREFSDENFFWANLTNLSILVLFLASFHCIFCS